MAPTSRARACGALVLLAVLTGCGSSDSPATPAASTAGSPTTDSPTTGSPTTGSPTTDPSADPSAGAGVEPATGAEMGNPGQFSVRLPEGFEVLSEGPRSRGAALVDATKTLFVFVSSSEDLGDDLDAWAATRLEDVAPRGERQDDRDIDGVPFFTVTSKDGPTRVVQLGAVRGGQYVDLRFESREPAAVTDEVVESMLATWTWLD
ncbi:MAG: hypothetical protein F2667_12310 [Actinobacteria bacterium]|uniref:Unannotated protein n=1 Tax=freshwater metagenome TaxID=449393 RepID=A0A6J6RXB1_9ZZZZ|nr:hypothetical protein [Actinomycetota bacterium]